MWLTLLESAEGLLITLSFASGYIIALFAGACIGIIAHILHRASEINLENQNFV